MKKFATIALLISLTCFAIAQPSIPLLDSIVRYHYNGDGDSIRQTKTDYIYNDKGQLISETILSWDAQNRTWIDGGEAMAEYYGYGRREFEYDSRGNRIRTLVLFWEENKQLYNEFRRIDKKYDENGNIIMQAHLQWDTAQRKWIGWNSYWAGLLGRMEYTYDSQNRPISEILFLWNDNINNWKSHEKNLFWYGNTGENIYEEMYRWDYENEDWMSVKKEKNIYNQAGNVTYNYLWYFRHWNGTLLERRTETKYDGENRPICIRSDTLNHEEVEWIPQIKGEYEYHIGESFTHIQEYRFDIKANKWYPSNGYKTYYEYDSMDNIIMEARYKLKYDSIYDPDYKYEYTYDKSGRLVMQAKYRGFQDRWLGENQGKEENVYDENGKLLLWTVFSWDGDSDNWSRIYCKGNEYSTSGLLMTEKHYLTNRSSQTLEIFSNSIYYYNGLITGKKEELLEPVNVYPNPTAGIINISGLSEHAYAEIYSLQGHMIQKIPPVQNTIDISSLKQGIFILKLYMDNGVITRRIIKL